MAPATLRLPENQLAREDVGHAAVAADRLRVLAEPRALPRAQVKVEVVLEGKWDWLTYCSLVRRARKCLESSVTVTHAVEANDQASH